MEKRMAGDYEIIHAFHIGDKEIVIGENVNTIGDERYMCAYCDRNEIFGLYSDLWCSDDFCEVVKKYSDRLSEQAEKTRRELRTPILQGIDITPILKAECTPVSSEDNLNGKIVVIKQEVLRQEYRRSTNQIKLCTGGFGASPALPATVWICIPERPADLSGKILWERYSQNSFPNGQQSDWNDTSRNKSRNPQRARRNGNGAENLCRLRHHPEHPG